MKLIIAGSRTFTPYVRHADMLNDLVAATGVTEIVSGCQTGADTFGEDYAKKYGLKVTLFPAQWKKHGPAAGPIRNRQMAEYADAVVLFPGGHGTASMKAEAHKAGIRVYDWRDCDDKASAGNATSVT